MEQNNKFGLIGYPLSHSFSKKYFTEKFERENITDCEYNLYPIEHIDQLPELISRTTGLRGLNVTIPFKETVIAFLDEMDPTAKTIGAVNCIRIGDQETGKKLIGYNTDVVGFRQSIKPFLETHHERALILGTGGAAKAVGYVLKEIGIDCYFVTREKSNQQGTNIFSYEELNEYMINAFKLIVNATPLGTFPNIYNFPKIPYNYITSSHLLYDLVYNPAETEFLKRGKQQNASVVNGLSMLRQQAEEAWKIWNS